MNVTLGLYLKLKNLDSEGHTDGEVKGIRKNELRVGRNPTVSTSFSNMHSVGGNMLFSVDIYPKISRGLAEGIAAIREKYDPSWSIVGPHIGLELSCHNFRIGIRKSGHDRTLKGQTWTGLLSQEGSAAHENK